MTIETEIEIRRFETPDEALDMKAQGGIDIVRMKNGNTGMYAVFEPGWTWETAREAPARLARYLPDAPHRLLPLRQAGGADGRDGPRDSDHKGRFLRNPARPRRLCRRTATGGIDSLRTPRAPALSRRTPDRTPSAIATGNFICSPVACSMTS